MLDGMNKKFANPYVIFYPVLSRDGMPFPINKCLKEIQGPNYREQLAWRGNLVIAKYRNEQLSALMDATMADFPLLKNYLSNHHSRGILVSLFPILHTSLHRLPNLLLHYVAPRFFDCEVNLLVLIRLLPPPACSAHTRMASHSRHRSHLTRLKRHRRLIPVEILLVWNRFLVFLFSGEGVRVEGELHAFCYRISPANGAHNHGAVEHTIHTSHLNALYFILQFNVFMVSFLSFASLVSPLP